VLDTAPAGAYNKDITGEALCTTSYLCATAGYIRDGAVMLACALEEPRGRQRAVYAYPISDSRAYIRAARRYSIDGVKSA
jgi:hypothetical protein